MMTPLTDDNYKDVLNDHFSRSEIVICGISPNPAKCEECVATQENAMKFFSSNPDSNIRFCFVDYTKYNALQNYYEIHQMNNYPKVIVFYGNWDDKEFIEGRITLERFEEISKKSVSKA